MRLGYAWLPLLLLLAAPGAHGQDEFAPARDSIAYRDLVERLASGDTLVDFMQLRFLFAAQPRPDRAVDAGSLLEQAEQAGDDATARMLVDSALVHLYGHVGAHRAAARVFAGRGDSARAALHRAVVRGFIRSMEAGGAGRPDGSIPVISVAEEYALLRERGLERVSQALTRCGEYRCDILKARDPNTGETFTFRFLLTWWRDP